MNIELPKDAEGREIPLDTVALYDDDGNVHNIRRFMYTNDFDSSDKWISSWTMVVDDYKTAKPEQMYLTSPDSWEKLEEDLDRAIGTPRPDNFDSITCGYFNSVGKNCQECKKRNGFDSSYCNKVAWKNILSRIRKLRGEDE